MWLTEISLLTAEIDEVTSADFGAVAAISVAEGDGSIEEAAVTWATTPTAAAGSD